MKGFTIVESTARGLYVLVERDDGTTFGREIPAASLTSPVIYRHSLDGQGNTVVTLVNWDDATDDERKAYVMESVEAVCREADFTFAERPVGHLVADKIGRPQTPKGKKV